jgi:hypothetical protein
LCKELKLEASVFGTEPSVGTNDVGFAWITYHTSEEESTQWNRRVVGSLGANASATTKVVAKKVMDFLRSIMKFDVDDFNYLEVQSTLFAKCKG